MIKHKIHDCGTDHSSGGSQQGINGLVDGIEIATRQKTLHKLNSGDSKKEDHENVVRQKMKAERTKELIFEKTAIPFRRDIDPDQRKNDTT